MDLQDKYDHVQLQQASDTYKNDERSSMVEYILDNLANEDLKEDIVFLSSVPHRITGKTEDPGKPDLYEVKSKLEFVRG